MMHLNARIIVSYKYRITPRPIQRYPTTLEAEVVFGRDAVHSFDARPREGCEDDCTSRIPCGDFIEAHASPLLMAKVTGELAPYSEGCIPMGLAHQNDSSRTPSVNMTGCLQLVDLEFRMFEFS